MKNLQKIVACLSLAACSVANAANMRELAFQVAMPAKVAPKIDGALDDACWKTATVHSDYYEYLVPNPRRVTNTKTDCLIFEPGSAEWGPETNAVFHKQGFFAVDPYVGCDFAVGKSFHLTLKADFLCCLSGGELLQPIGPRFYFGFIFYH